MAYTYNSRVCYGRVEKLISISGCKLAFLKQLKVTEQPLSSDVHISSTVYSKLLEDFIFVEELDKLVAVEVHQIPLKCFNTTTGDRSTQVTCNVNMSLFWNISLLWHTITNMISINMWRNICDVLSAKSTSRPRMFTINLIAPEMPHLFDSVIKL